MDEVQNPLDPTWTHDLCSAWELYSLNRDSELNLGSGSGSGSGYFAIDG
jgi:hypothetical protein